MITNGASVSLLSHKLQNIIILIDMFCQIYVLVIEVVQYLYHIYGYFHTVNKIR